MCDISKPTKLKTKKVYKVCIKVNRDYYSIFALKKIKVGEVGEYLHREQTEVSSLTGIPPCWGRDNPLMAQMVSGFASISTARQLKSIRSNSLRVQIHLGVFKIVILEMMLGGTILKGTSAGISSMLPKNRVTYAGSEIISFKEVE